MKGFKKYKKITALLLAATMTVSTAQFNAFAADGITETVSTTVESVIETIENVVSKILPSAVSENGAVATPTQIGDSEDGLVFTRVDNVATATELIEIPDWYNQDEVNGCYSFEDRDGDIQYRVYGHYGNDKNAWFEYYPESEDSEAIGLEVDLESEYADSAPLHYTLYDEADYTDEIWQKLYDQYKYISDSSIKSFVEITADNYAYDEELGVWSILLSSEDEDTAVRFAYGKADNDKTAKDAWISFSDLDVPYESEYVYTSLESMKQVIDTLYAKLSATEDSDKGYSLSKESYEILSAYMESLDNALDADSISEDEYNEASDYLSEMFESFSVLYEKFGYDPYEAEYDWTDQNCELSKYLGDFYAKAYNENGTVKIDVSFYYKQTRMGTNARISKVNFYNFFYVSNLYYSIANPSVTCAFGNVDKNETQLDSNVSAYRISLTFTVTNVDALKNYDSDGNSAIDIQYYSSSNTDYTEIMSQKAGGLIQNLSQALNPGYTVTFNSNGGDYTPATVSQTTGFNLPTSAGTRTGYIFKGWSTDGSWVANGGDWYNVTYDHTLYAQWTPITYTVVYHGGSGTSGSMGNQTLTYDAWANLSGNGFSKPDKFNTYSFAGWGTYEGSNTVVYGDGAWVGNLANTQGATVNLYAVWKNNYADSSFNIILNPSPGTGGTTSIVQKYGSLIPSISIPSRTGYDFAGYVSSDTGTKKTYIDADGDGVTAWDIPVNDATLTSEWTAHTYTIKFDKNASDATGSIADMAMTYDVTKSLTSNDSITRPHFDFCGWSTDPNATYKSSGIYVNGADVKNLTADKNGVVTLYAVWKRTVSTLTLTMDAVEEYAEFGDEAMTFDINDSTDGYRYKVTLKPGETKELTLPSGSYTVKPLAMARYNTFTLGSCSSNIVSLTNGAIANLNNHEAGTIHFSSSRARWDKFSHASVAESTIDNSWL